MNKMFIGGYEIMGPEGFGVLGYCMVWKFGLLWVHYSSINQESKLVLNN